MKKNLLLTIALLCSLAVNAQWIQTTNTTSRDLVFHNSRIIGGGGSSGGILLSDDDGTTWTASNTGVPASDVMNVGPKLVLGNTIFAVSINKVFTSVDNGASWAAAAPTLPATSIISIFYYDGTTIFVTYQDGKVFTSTDGGTTFSLKGNIGYYPVALISHNGKLYAGTNAYGMYTSVDGGATWVADNPGIASGDRAIYALNAFGGDLYFGTYSGKIYKMAAGMATWALVNTGSAVRDFSNKNNVIMAATDNGYVASTDGITWAANNTGLSGNDIYFLHIYTSNTNVFVTKFYGGVIKRGFSELGINYNTAVYNTPSKDMGRLYPNPATSTLYYDAKDGAALSYTLMDIAGRKVTEGSFNSSKEISLDNIPTGFYVVKIETKNGTFISRIVKQ